MAMTGSWGMNNTRVDKKSFIVHSALKYITDIIFPLKIYLLNPFCWYENEFALPELTVDYGWIGVQKRDVLEMQ